MAGVGGSGRDDGELLPGLSSIPGVVRLGADAWVRGAMWGASAGITAAEKAGSLALAGLGLADDAETAAAEALRQRRRESEPGPEERPKRSQARSLRDRGAELLDRASDVAEDPNVVHPGFARIIDQLAPGRGADPEAARQRGAAGDRLRQQGRPVRDRRP